MKINHHAKGPDGAKAYASRSGSTLVVDYISAHQIGKSSLVNPEFSSIMYLALSI